MIMEICFGLINLLSIMFGLFSSILIGGGMVM